MNQYWTRIQLALVQALRRKEGGGGRGEAKGYMQNANSMNRKDMISQKKDLKNTPIAAKTIFFSLAS